MDTVISLLRCMSIAIPFVQPRERKISGPTLERVTLKLAIEFR